MTNVANPQGVTIWSLADIIPIEMLPSGAPIGHHAIQQQVEALTVVVLHQVAEFMYEDIVHGTFRDLDQLEIQRDRACLRTASPTGFEVLNRPFRRGDPQALKTREQGFQAFLEDAGRLFPIPAFHLCSESESCRRP